MVLADVELEVEIKDIVLDPSLNLPVVMLEPKSGGPLLPIWVGAFEANAIALFFEKERFARPLTHDLFISALTRLDARVVKLVITDLSENTFLSLLYVDHGGSLVALDARPSDGIALALRAGAPVFVRRSVFDKAQAHEAAKKEPAAYDETEEEPMEDESGGEKPEWRM
jgi:bifunctional DNase/RNase